MFLIGLMCDQIPASPDNFKRYIKCQFFQTSFYIVALSQWQTLYSHLRLIFGRDPFKVIKM